MATSDTQKLKTFSAELSPTLWIGKYGTNDAIVVELQRQLKLRKMVKVKMLKAALFESSREEIAHKLSTLRTRG